MKSFSCEVKESEDRLFSIALPNDVHLSDWKKQPEVDLRLAERAGLLANRCR